MFDVTHSGDSYVCTLKISGRKSALVELTGMKCRLDLSLGAAGKSPSAKALLPKFKKTLNELYAKRSERAVQELFNKAAFLSDQLKKGETASALETELRRDIDVIWPRMCTKLLPGLADEALLATIKSSKEEDAARIAETKKAANGKAELVPVLKIAAATGGAIVAPGALAALAALFSIWSAYKDDMQRIDGEIGHLDASSKAVEADLKALNDAIARISRRVDALRTAQAGVAKSAMAAAASERQIARHLAALEKAAGDANAREIAALKAQLATSARGSEALRERLQSVDGLAAAVGTLDKAAGAVATELGKIKTSADKGWTVSKKLTDISANSLKILGVLGKVFK